MVLLLLGCTQLFRQFLKEKLEIWDCKDLVRFQEQYNIMSLFKRTKKQFSIYIVCSNCANMMWV